MEVSKEGWQTIQSASLSELDLACYQEVSSVLPTELR